MGSIPVAGAIKGDTERIGIAFYRILTQTHLRVNANWVRIFDQDRWELAHVRSGENIAVRHASRPRSKTPNALLALVFLRSQPNQIHLRARANWVGFFGKTKKREIFCKIFNLID